MTALELAKVIHKISTEPGNESRKGITIGLLIQGTVDSDKVKQGYHFNIIGKKKSHVISILPGKIEVQVFQGNKYKLFMKRTKVPWRSFLK